MQARKASSSSSISLLNALKIIQVDRGNSGRRDVRIRRRETDGSSRPVAFETLVTIIIASRGSFVFALFHAALGSIRLLLEAS